MRRRSPRGHLPAGAGVAEGARVAVTAAKIIGPPDETLTKERVREAWQCATAWLDEGYGLPAERRRAETLAALAREWLAQHGKVIPSSARQCPCGQPSNDVWGLCTACMEAGIAAAATDDSCHHSGPELCDDCAPGRLATEVLDR